MPDFGTKNVYFPHKKYRGKMSQETNSDNIVYVEFENEVRAYDDIRYPSSYADSIIKKLNETGNPDKIIAVWQGGYCSWKHPDWWKKTEEVKPKRPDPTESDDLPF
tara:strand:- start:4747 stop:5064 length:318 start_codon:yes stop_codon:yes gene_type:complete